MPKITLHKFALDSKTGLPGDGIGDDVTLDVTSPEEVSEKILEMLGGEPDAEHEESETSVVYRRLDATAPGGRGYAARLQVNFADHVAEA